MKKILFLLLLLFSTVTLAAYTAPANQTELISPKDAFGDVRTSSLTPVSQNYFPNSIIRSTEWTTVLTGSGSATADLGMAVMQTGAATSSSAGIFSKIPVKYNPGQGAMFRFTTLFTACTAGSTQWIGAGDDANALAVGCNGATFSMLHKHPARSHKAITSITRSGNTATVTSVAHGYSTGDYVSIIGTSATEPDYIGTFQITVTGTDTYTYTVANTPATPASGTLYSDLIVNEVVAKTAFSHDKLDGTGRSAMTIDITKLNVWECRYQYLGGGSLSCSIENPATGQLNLVHIKNYANANTVPSFSNPTLPLFVRASNTSNATNIITKTASMAFFTEGANAELCTPFSYNNTKTGITTETNLLTIKDKRAFNGYLNKVRAKTLSVIFSSDGTGTNPVIFSVTRNTTLGGSPSYADKSVNESVSSFDTAGTTLTGGTVLSSFQLSRNTGTQLTVPIYQNPEETLSFSCSSSSSVACSVSVNTCELF
jgi:hypothetical protein